MSRTRKLTLSAMVAALCVACMALSLLIPRVTLAITALAGIFPAVVVITCGCGWAAGASAVAAALGLLILCCFVLIVLETLVSLLGRRNYSGDVRLRETAGLIAWFRSTVLPRLR